MAISIKIHSFNPTQNTGVVTVKDDETVIINKKNISLEPNPDGMTANTFFIKKYVLEFRTNNLDSNINIDIGT